MGKRALWLLIADMARPDVPLAVPTLAWMAREAGVDFEAYLEAGRDGRLFARTGSTVLGGAHHQAFNYLNAVFDVEYILLGETALFDSSIAAFGAPVLARTGSLAELYRTLLARPGVARPAAAVFGPGGPVAAGEWRLEIGPYLFPDIFYRRALGFPAAASGEARALLHDLGIDEGLSLYLPPEEQIPGGEELDAVRPGDDYGSLTLRIAERWKGRARGLAFGDPAAILSQLPAHCREARVAVFAEKRRLPPAEIAVSAYTEERTAIAEDVIRLATEIGNRVVVGRQTGDGDLFAWSRGGVCLQIADPNRPPFPIIETVPHPWARTAESLYDDEPDDATLRRYATEGKLLATLLWHSGEMAHNEAMLNLVELASFTGVKMGLGVHAARYETCPQLWELLQVPRDKGGVRGLIEPVLHSGGLGVLAEVNCPPALLRAHCAEALARIRRLAGEGAAPRGYYAFLDADLATLSRVDPAIFAAIEASGLEYIVSSARPGRNRVLWETAGCIALNQSCTSVTGASPFVRVTTLEELQHNRSSVRPGWCIATLDAPVIAFNPYIWRHGSRFMRIVDWLLQDRAVVNVTPRAIARYARILRAAGSLPPSTATLE